MQVNEQDILDLDVWAFCGEAKSLIDVKDNLTAEHKADAVKAAKEVINACS